MLRDPPVFDHSCTDLVFCARIREYLELSDEKSTLLGKDLSRVYRLAGLYRGFLHHSIYAIRDLHDIAPVLEVARHKALTRKDDPKSHMKLVHSRS